MRQPTTLLTVGLLCAYIGACSSTKQNTLGKLKYEERDEAPIVFEKLNHEQVREEYKELLDVFEDEQLKEKIERRIADVYMVEGTQNHIDDNSEKSNYYVDAIKAYRNVLERYPNSPDNAEVLYQLAKAYDMEGEQLEAKKMLLELTSRHPNYINNAEAYFRLGDIYFGYQEYKQAAKAYTAVTQLGNEKLKLNAHYMLGWSKYKMHQYRASTDAFTYVLAAYLGENSNLDGLNAGEKTVVEDTLHSLSLSLDKIGGAEIIASHPQLKNKNYAWIVYEQLGEFYFDKKLYANSADAYRQFLDANPLSIRAPRFHSLIISTYNKGKFPKLALEEKQRYVEHFGIYSEFYKQYGAEKDTLASLNTFLDELARHHYSLGTAATKKVEQLNALKNPKPKDLETANKKKRENFATAAKFYGEYLATFPSDKRYDEVVFLQSEAYFSSAQFDKAIRGYEHVAYTPKGNSAKKHAADSGYIAILSYQKHISQFDTDSKAHTEWQQKAVDSMLKFSEVYHADKRSPGVLTNAAEYLFSLNQYQRAIDIGNALITKNTKLDSELKKTAHGLVAHSYFKLDDYANAQSNYIQQRNLVSSKSDEFKSISERIASTTFKLSEQKLAEEDTQAAIKELLRIKTLTPNSPVRIIAQYDAATLMLGESQWQQAIKEFIELDTLYPKHELAAEFPRKIAFAHKEAKNWDQAADAYLRLHRNDKNENIRREALFTAAQMFEQNKHYDTAIKHYKQYAYAYEKPFETRMEARYKLAVNYTKLGEAGKSLYWLRRIIDGNKNAGNEATERSQWLAAWAHNEYGDSFAKEYKGRRLSLPIVRSLPKKKKAMENAISHYERAADFGFLEFVTMSGFKIAGLYEDLGTSVLRSPRPRGLSASDKEMYNNIMAEQAAPLNALAIDLHLANAERAWQGEYNNWIQKSFDELSRLNPNRFAKQEKIVSYGDEIR